jgi:hypothetical protein
MARIPDDAPERFGNITERNVFGLKNAPTQETTAPQAVEKSKVKLTGITTMLGDKRAILRVLPPSPKQGQPTARGQQTPEGESLILTEGQREGDVEVVQIDEDAGVVKLVAGGETQTITFDKEPIQPVASAGGGVMAGTQGMNQPGMVAGFNTNRPVSIASMAPPPLPASTRSAPIPSRSYNPGVGTLTSNTYTPPSLQAPAAALPVSPQPQASLDRLTPEEQAALLQLQEQLNQQNRGQATTPPSPAGTPEQYRYQYNARSYPGWLPPSPPQSTGQQYFSQ